MEPKDLKVRISHFPLTSLTASMVIFMALSYDYDEGFVFISIVFAICDDSTFRSFNIYCNEPI